ncbi:hypothetical protein GY45DRAFT_643911 [Cubamyces sp. BRFM 1775]|nr:hypothetical protein GY45DRAFT_643911 [Cubamyces sp. BRFM 1775]
MLTAFCGCARPRATLARLPTMTMCSPPNHCEREHLPGPSDSAAPWGLIVRRWVGRGPIDDASTETAHQRCVIRISPSTHLRTAQQPQQLSSAAQGVARVGKKGPSQQLLEDVAGPKTSAIAPRRPSCINGSAMPLRAAARTCGPRTIHGPRWKRGGSCQQSNPSSRARAPSLLRLPAG